jgi:predicted alpha/beta-hydrolase family hydrolase
MFSFKTLEITGYRDEPVPHTFLKQDVETDHVAILLPGVGYTTHMPLLYYPASLLLTMGADVLRVETVYIKQADFGALPGAEKARWAFADATAVCRAALDQRLYRRITLVGKSLGTLAMGYLLGTEDALAQARAIWLTPLLSNDLLRAQIQQAKSCSLFAVGTADPHYDATRLAEVQAVTGGKVVVIEGANHSLEVEGDVKRSLQALEEVMDAIQAFLG